MQAHCSRQGPGFAAFVEAGGYTRRQLWTHPFEQDSRTLSFEEAMARFKDSTGRPGPATWKLGSYADGEEDLPVTGLSWYEATMRSLRTKPRRSLYRLLGAAPVDKKHLVFPGGHSSFGWTNELIKEGLHWLDQRFGPVVH